MSDNPKEAEKEMEKAIFISADCWLEVFHLLPPSQLGLGIALISHRFDFYVNEHFRTRKWKLGEMEIGSKIGMNWAKEMEIVNSDGKTLPIPQNPLPNKVIGFGRIEINFFDHNVITFLQRFHHFFVTSETEIRILTENVQISEFVMRNIWPMLKDTIHAMSFNSITFFQMRQFSPSILFDCPSLHFVFFVDVGILPEFPPDDSANASDGQAVAKWLFMPHAHNLPKVLGIMNPPVDQWPSTVEQIRTAFLNASSPVNFGICVKFPPSSSFPAVEPFELTNEFTGDKLKLSQLENSNVFVISCCPIAVGNGEIWEKKMHELFNGRTNNKIEIYIGDHGVDKSLLGSSGDQKQQKKNWLMRLCDLLFAI